MKIKIKEHSLLAKLAAKKLHSTQMAMAFGNTIRLHNTSKEEFLKNITWVRHEVAHIHQSKKRGAIVFLLSYLLESFYVGYQFNKYEVEAVEMEKNEHILDNVEFI